LILIFSWLSLPSNFSFVLFIFPFSLFLKVKCIKKVKQRFSSENVRSKIYFLVHPLITSEKIKAKYLWQGIIFMITSPISFWRAFKRITIVPLFYFFHLIFLINIFFSISFLTLNLFFIELFHSYNSDNGFSWLTQLTQGFLFS